MKKVFLSIMLVLIAVTMASCESKPDASVLVTPEIEFRAIKGVNDTEFKIDILNIQDIPSGTNYGTDVECIVADASGNVLFSKADRGKDAFAGGVYGNVIGVNAGDTLTCTVTFNYYGYETSATASDVVM